jgi:chemotaxis protein CheC
MRLGPLDEVQVDALREAGSIGAGHAATALSQLVDRRISIEVPRVQVVDYGDVPDVFGGPEALVAAVHIALLGEIGGSMLLVVPHDGALALVDLMRGRASGTTRSLGADERALVTHAASLIVSAYVSAIGRLADVSMLPAGPAFALDMAEALLESVTSDMSMRCEDVLLLLTRFIDEETSVDAYLFFLPEPAGLEVLLCRLGVGG